MKVATITLMAALAASSLSACGDGDATSPPAMCTGNTLIAKEANNYKFMSTLKLAPVSVAPRPNDLTINWGGVTKDFLGHPINPTTDIDMIEVIVVNLPLAQLETMLNDDGTLATAILATVPPPALMTNGTATSANLTTFQVNSYPVGSADIANYLDPVMYPPATTSYVAIAASGTELGKGSLMIQAFKVDPASSNTTITISNTSTTLTYTADLHSAAPTGVTAGTAGITLDWGMMTTNALGGQFVTTNITSALIGHYTQTVGQLEKDFLNLETLPTALYRGGIDFGTVVDFSTLMTTGGQAFTGIDDTGTWLLGLECGNCGIPAPWYLTVLKVCTP
jgi:hypothetical protein